MLGTQIKGIDSSEAMMNKIVKQYPLRRLGKTEDVVGTILFLFS